MATATRLPAEEAVTEDSKSRTWHKSRDTIDSPKPRSIRSSSCNRSNNCKQHSREYRNVNTEVKILTPRMLKALPVMSSETPRSNKQLEISGTEEKKTEEKGKKEKKKKGHCIFPQDGKKGGTKLPAEKIPHQNSSSLSLQSSMISQKKTTVAQQISSAKLHRIKELKNEISDLQCKLEASSLENCILKELHYRHLKAIDRYENLGSNLQDLLASHYNEVRTLRKSLRMSQEDERNSSRRLREVEASLVKAKGALQTLHMLSGDKTLAEREELDHRLSVLTEKIKANDKRIQSLEKQLKLNNSSFSRQLANENRKALEAGIITKTLQMEINSLHQKIKEKDRQLYIKNIYANRMPKSPKGKSDAVPHGKSFRIHRSVQVDKDIFRPLLLSEYEAQETETSPLQLTKEEISPEDKSQKAEVNEVYTDAQCRTEKQSTKKIPEPETFNRTHRDYFQEGRPLMEEHICLEFTEKEKETDLLKRELKEVMKTEQTPLSDSMKENNQETDAVEEHEKEENKPDKELSNSEQPGSNCVISGPRNRTTIRLNKKYIFSEATENLHYGLLTSGTRSKHSRLCKHRQDCSGTAESKVKNSFGLYEPAPGKGTQRRQDSSTEAEAVLM